MRTWGKQMLSYTPVRRVEWSRPKEACDGFCQESGMQYPLSSGHMNLEPWRMYSFHCSSLWCWQGLVKLERPMQMDTPQIPENPACWCWKIPRQIEWWTRCGAEYIIYQGAPCIRRGTILGIYTCMKTAAESGPFGRTLWMESRVEEPSFSSLCHFVLTFESLWVFFYPHTKNQSDDIAVALKSVYNLDREKVCNNRWTVLEWVDFIFLFFKLFILEYS